MKLLYVKISTQKLIAALKPSQVRPLKDAKEDEAPYLRNLYYANHLNDKQQKSLKASFSEQFEEFLTDYLTAAVSLTDKELDIIEWSKQWFNVGIVTPTENLTKTFFKLTIPKKFKQVKSKYLYRGMFISVNNYRKCLSGADIKLKKSVFSSWSTDLESAKNFIQVDLFSGGKPTQGIIIKVPTKELNILLNFHYIYPFLTDSDLNFEVENEVLVNGSGIDKLTKEILVLPYGDKYSPSSEERLNYYKQHYKDLEIKDDEDEKLRNYYYVRHPNDPDAKKDKADHIRDRYYAAHPNEVTDNKDKSFVVRGIFYENNPDKIVLAKKDADWMNRERYYKAYPEDSDFLTDPDPNIRSSKYLYQRHKAKVSAAVPSMENY